MKGIVLGVISVIVVVLTFAAIGSGDVSLDVDDSNLEQREEEVKLIDANEGGLPEERDTKKEGIIEDKDNEDKGNEDKNKEDKSKEDKSNKSEETGE